MVEVHFSNLDGVGTTLTVWEGTSVCWECHNGKPGDATNTGGMDWDHINDRDREVYLELEAELAAKANELLLFMQSRESGYKKIYEGMQLMDEGYRSAWKSGLDWVEPMKEAA